VPDYTPYDVEVITPEGAAFAGQAQMLVVPGSEGQLGILDRHAPLISTLDVGETRIMDEGGELHRFATGSGFVEVRASEALVLVDEAVPAERIDVSDAHARLERAREDLQRARAGDGDVYRAELEVEVAENLVRVGGG
jgi:F-type H+-transporting ATPase subunit epsilon